MANDRGQTGKNYRKSQHEPELGKDKKFYNEDMSRKAVGRLFNDNVVIDAKPAKTDITVKEMLNETDEETSDKEYFDYINHTSQRNQKEQALKEVRRESMKKSREESIREVHKAKEEYTENSPVGAVIDFFVNSEARYIIAGVLILILILFTFMIVKINSTGAKLKKANTELAAYEEQKANYDSLLIENADLKAKVSDLTADISELNAKISEMSATATNPADQSTNTPTTPGNTQPSTGARTHTVVSGDTAFGLAEKYYGTASQANVDKIANANPTVPDIARLQVGMKLIIP